MTKHYDEPEFDPPKITCCESAKATGGAYHSPRCPNRPDRKELPRTGIRRRGKSGAFRKDAITES